MRAEHLIGTLAAGCYIHQPIRHIDGGPARERIQTYIEPISAVNLNFAAIWKKGLCHLERRQGLPSILPPGIPKIPSPRRRRYSFLKAFAPGMSSLAYAIL
jgi:hypothetical protein